MVGYYLLSFIGQGEEVAMQLLLVKTHDEEIRIYFSK